MPNRCRTVPQLPPPAAFLIVASVRNPFIEDTQ